MALLSLFPPPHFNGFYGFLKLHQLFILRFLPIMFFPLFFYLTLFFFFKRFIIRMESLDQSFLNKSWADIVDEDELELPIPTLDQPESQHLDDSKTNVNETSPEDNKHASNSLPDNNNASPKGKLISKLANFDAEKYPHTNPWFTLTEEEKAEQTAIWEAESAERSKLPGASASRWAPGNAGKYSSSSISTTTTSFPRKPTLSSSPPASPPNKIGTAASKWATADNAPSAPKYSNKRYGDSYDRHNSKHNYSDRSNYTSPSSSRYNRNGGFDNKENFTRENRLRDYYQLTNEAPEGQKSPENGKVHAFDSLKKSLFLTQTYFYSSIWCNLPCRC